MCNENAAVLDSVSIAVIKFFRVKKTPVVSLLPTISLKFLTFERLEAFPKTDIFTQIHLSCILSAPFKVSNQQKLYLKLIGQRGITVGHKNFLLLLTMMLFTWSELAQARYCHRERRASERFCEGDTVKLYVNHNSPRFGTITHIAVDGQARVEYFHDARRFDVWRHVLDLALEVDQLDRLYVNAPVHFLVQGNHRQGVATRLFSDGSILIDYQHDYRSFTAWRNLNEVGVGVGQFRHLYQGATVFFTVQNNPRQGRIKELYDNNQVFIEYRHDGRSFTAWRNFNEVAIQVDCVQGVCTNNEVRFQVNRNDRLGEVIQAFENGQLFISYHHQGRRFEAWRNVRETTAIGSSRRNTTAPAPTPRTSPRPAPPTPPVNTPRGPRYCPPSMAPCR